jgi:hypothetical protein
LKTIQQEPMEPFQNEASEMAAAFNGLIQSLVASKRDRPEDKAAYLHRNEGLDGRRHRGHSAHTDDKGCRGVQSGSRGRNPHDPDRLRGARGRDLLPEAMRQFEKE